MKISLRAWMPGVITTIACAGLLAGAPAAQAREGAHQHGAIRMEVAIEGDKLTVRIDAPLDSLLGFEHRPRTDAQRRAAVALLARMRNGTELLIAPAAAQCSVASVAIEAESLTAAVTAARPAGQKEHADLEATYEFKCQRPDQLQAIEVALFAAFPRLQRIDARIVSARGQSSRTLRRPDKLLRLAR